MERLLDRRVAHELLNRLRVDACVDQQRGEGQREHAQALSAFEQLQGELIGIGVDADLARHAGEQAESLVLRGYDAVHLTTALELGDVEVVVVTWGRDLARAAETVGLGIAGVD